MVKFIFDLDGTITKLETLPIIAKHFSIYDEIEKFNRKKQCKVIFPLSNLLFTE